MFPIFVVVLSVLIQIDSMCSVNCVLFNATVSGSFPNNCFYFKALEMCLMLQQFAAKRGDQESLLENMNSKYYYYTRTKGLFRICYPKERPPTGKFLTPRRSNVEWKYS
jgi:hypothetical protein